MSIIFNAVKQREAQNAPKIATLYREVPKRFGMLSRRARVACLAVLGVLAMGLLTHVAMRRHSEPSALAAPEGDFADVLALPTLPPHVDAVRKALASAARPAASDPPPAAASTPARSALAAPIVAKFKPPTNLTQPLPGPTAIVPVDNRPGQVPPPPAGAGLPQPWAAAAAEVVRAVPVDSPKPLSELPPELKEAVERLRVRVYLYAPQRRNRMVLTDGRQLREGDELTEGLRLEEITPTGMVLRHGALRVLAPMASASP
jgi:hypothetical protein